MPIAGPFVGELEGDVVGGFCNKEKNTRCEQDVSDADIRRIGIVYATQQCIAIQTSLLTVILIGPFDGAVEGDDVGGDYVLTEVDYKM